MSHGPGIGSIENQQFSLLEKPKKQLPISISRGGEVRYVQDINSARTQLLAPSISRTPRFSLSDRQTNKVD